MQSLIYCHDLWVVSKTFLPVTQPGHCVSATNTPTPEGIRDRTEFSLPTPSPEFCLTTQHLLGGAGGWGGLAPPPFGPRFHGGKK